MGMENRKKTDFDRIIDRTHTNSLKWDAYPGDVLPIWVADMDFAVPQPIQDALAHKVEHGVFGYERACREHLETVALRMQKLYGWQVEPNMVLAVPGIVSGFNLAALAACQPGDGMLIQPPVYPHFLKAPGNTGLQQQVAPLTPIREGQTLRYEADMDAFEAAFKQAGIHTGMFLLCNPHNPTGAVYSPNTLTQMAEICLQNDTIICSDEIHSELLLGNTPFTPIATLSPEIAERSITLVAPSKTFNVAGLFCGFAIIPNKDLRSRYQKQSDRLTMHVSSLGLAASEAAFSGACDDWLVDLLAYLTANRDILVDFVRTELPGIRTTVPDATYMAWMDCSQLVEDGTISGSPYKFFLNKGRVALNNGDVFGPGGENFVRFNFACPRERMLEALNRMKNALSG